METVYLDRNENNYGPSPKCLEVLKSATPDLFYMYSTDYKNGYKSALSNRLATEFSITEDRVLLGYGAEDLLKQVVQTYLNRKKKKLLIPDHSWWYYKEIANEVKGKSVEYPIVEGKDSYQYDIDKLMEIYNESNPEVVFLASPNNPTGNSISDEQLTYVLDRMTKSIVVLDEAYWFSNGNEKTTELVNKYSNLIIIRTFSKLYALAGIRIGYALVGSGLKRIKKLSNRYLGYNRLSEKVAIAAMDSFEYYNDISKKMAADRELYFTELSKVENIKVFKSDANFVLVKIPKESISSLKELFVGKGLVIKFMNEEIVNSHLRISLGTQEQNRRVIDAITEFYKTYNS
ncbi:MAG: histidinol-phosphate aminotransferase family protein [Bacteroidetes bacterium]|nr:histidinol-phosphate aminotransferase family protein [Bacteroidota bacterium]MBU1117266.1 histidinol-phosphate aminotransferase family protein [Bacteroidota bacterium]MBU1800072.1 histidinol-phosphate aminotransferase family protein [Bacteroidota bacterium]